MHNSMKIFRLIYMGSYNYIDIYISDANCIDIYCILRGRIKGFNSSITTIMCQGGSYRTVVG